MSTSKKKKSNKLGSSIIKRIWNEEEELALLKGLVDYRVETGLQPNADWNAFYRFMGDSIVSKFSKEQLLSKISKLKKKFLVQFEKINQGNDPLFTDSEVYELSNMIWGQNESQFADYVVNKQKDNRGDTFREDEQVANAEPLNENVAEKIDFNDKIAENETTGKESNDNDIVVDELGAVVDAYETLLSQDLSSNEKKLQLEKVAKIGNEKRKEISREWKELCAEKAKLKMKKLRLAVKLAEAVNES